MNIHLYPLDYEEFCDASGNNYELLHQIYNTNKAVGQATNRKLMRDLRTYMAVGGMPQAVESYIAGENFSQIDMVNDRSSLYTKMILKRSIPPAGSQLYIILFRHS